MTILRGTDDEVKMKALLAFKLKPRARAGDGLSDEYDTTDTPDSVDELDAAISRGLLTPAQRMQLRQQWYEESLKNAAQALNREPGQGDAPDQEATRSSKDNFEAAPEP